jgi:hypothetical protein
MNHNRFNEGIPKIHLTQIRPHRLVVAGAFPYSIAIGGIPEMQATFDSEWPIEKYERSSLLE